jgi:Holliday junction resolvase RusA-like endonuclease
MWLMTTARVTSKERFDAFVEMVGGKYTLALTIPLNPVPASRPRVSKYGVFYTKTYASWKRQAQLYLPKGVKDDLSTRVWPDKRQHLVVCTEFIIKKARTSKLTTPKGDLDNYTKAAWDAVTKSYGVWNDDDQVVLGIEHEVVALHCAATPPTLDIGAEELRR